MSTVASSDKVSTDYPKLSLLAVPIHPFAPILKAPIVELYVGQERIKYHVHEDILCGLEFFRRALKGNFKEASEKTISMPEDDPGLIAALIQYLYSRNYKCDFRGRGACGNPELLSLHLIDVYFHWELYITAEKYLYKELQEVAKKRLLPLYKGLGDIILEYGMMPADFRRWINSICTEYPDEFEKTMLDCPKLAHDLLCITSTPEPSGSVPKSIGPLDKWSDFMKKE